MVERSINLTERQATLLMVVLSEKPNVLERLLRTHQPLPCTEKELQEVSIKARKICWEFHQAKKVDELLIAAVQQPLSKKVERESWRCQHCGSMVQEIEGDCPAGRWGWVCGGCGKKV